MARVLLVDENIVTRALSRKTLLLAGHQVVDASSGHDTLTALASARFDVIVLDTALPDMEGIDAIERIRSTAGYAHTPIIAMSDAELAGAALAGLAGTPTTRVRKPCTPHELTDAVARALERAAAASVDEITLPDAQRAPQREP